MPEITSQQVMTLRGKTGAGIMDCKNALKETDGDLEKAVEILRKKGLSGLAKRAGREMKEGIARVKVSDDRKTYAMIEINCETDFVARNPEVRSLGEELLGEMLAGKFSDPTRHDFAREKLRELAARVGENMQIRRGTVYEKPRNGVVNYYVHGDMKKSAMVSLVLEKEPDEAAEKELMTLARELAMQAVAMHPVYLKKEDVPPKVIEKEKEIYRASPKAQGKSETALSKMLEGRMRKFFEENCLLEQVSIRDSRKKISTLVNEFSAKLGGEIKVEKFDCYIVGIE